MRGYALSVEFVLLLWLEKRCLGKIGLAETNHTRKWHIDSINYLFFSHRIQTLIEYNCYQSNQWIYSHERGCVERDLFCCSQSNRNFCADADAFLPLLPENTCLLLCELFS